MSKTIPAEILAAQIRAGLAATGCTQTDLAAKIGSNQPNISAILLGKRNPGWSAVCEIADALGIVISTPDE